MKNILARILGWVWKNPIFIGDFLFKKLLYIWMQYFPMDVRVYTINPKRKPQFPYLEFLFSPGSLLTGPLFLGVLFLTLINHPKFTSLPGTSKIILISGYSEGQWFTLGKSFFITPNTSLKGFIQVFLSSLQKLESLAYPIHYFDLITVKVVSKSAIHNPPSSLNTPRVKISFAEGQKRFYSSIPSTPLVYLPSNIQPPKWVNWARCYRVKSITPLKGINTPNFKLGVVDIETLPIDSRHIPYAIGYRLLNPDSTFTSKSFYLTDYEGDIEIASQTILDTFMADFLEKARGYHIYVHNLGSFDGYLLMRTLFKSTRDLNVLMDQSKSIISITLPTHNISFRDSLRIFPASLKELCKIFNVPIPKGSFDHTSVTFERLKELTFKEELLDYLDKDLISLLDVIITATNTLHERYQIDLSKVFSTASLAMTIYRSKFLNMNIPILPRPVDTFVRNSFKGGATEVYKCFGSNLYYYDVNSLYPHAMTQPMPYNFLGVEKGREIDLDNFFGFIYAQIYVSPRVKTPVLPWTDPHSGRLLFPRGRFAGHYFSEELKTVRGLGYYIVPLVGYKFDSEYLFNDYVDFHYALKSTSTGPERYITKLLLNGLYGFFGRGQNTWTAEILPCEAAYQKLFTHPAYEFFNIDDDHVFLLSDPMPSKQMLEAQNLTYKDLLDSNRLNSTNASVLSNVAIASAITAYARIVIIPIKTNKKNLCLYSDTDSCFLQHPLPSHMVGNGLGQFKDELNGSIITQALFLGDKFYGYKTPEYTKVVAAGLPTTTIEGRKTSVITYEELEATWSGGSFTYTRHNIIKSLSDLSLYNSTSNINTQLNPHAQKKVPIFDNQNRVTSYRAPAVFHTTQIFRAESLYYRAKYLTDLLRTNFNRLRGLFDKSNLS